MSRKTIWYSVDDNEQRFGLSIPETWDAMRPREQQTIAELCAENYHSEHDGWESRWPIELALYEAEEGDPIARLEIDREAVPQFTAHQVKPNA